MNSWDRLLKYLASRMGFSSATRVRSRAVRQTPSQVFVCEQLEARALLSASADDDVTLASQLGTVTIGEQVGTLTYGSADSVTYLVTVDRGADPGEFTAILTLTTTLPAGVTFAFDDDTLDFAESDDSLTAILTVTSSTSSPASDVATLFTVQAQLSADPTDIVTGDGELTIDRKVLTGSITAENKSFDGTDSADVLTRTLSGVVAGDDVTYVGGIATFDDENVGANKTVTATGLALSGAAASNYTVNDTAVTAASIVSDLAVGPLIVNDLPNTKDELVAIPVSLLGGGSVSYSVESTNTNVTATLVSGGRSLRMKVSGVDENGTPFSGELIFRLFENENPLATSKIIALAESGFYDGLDFHRIIDGFVAQGGRSTAPGSPNTPFSDEFNTNLTFTSNGLLALANSGDDTNTTQFFITDVDETLGQLPQHLNFQHTIFGILTNGFDTFRSLISTPTDDGDVPLTEVLIEEVTVFDDTQNAVVRLHATPGTIGSTTLKVTANDGEGSTDEVQAVVNVVADTVNDRAFLGPVTNQTTNQGTAVTFNVNGIDLENDALTFFVKDPASFPDDDSVGSNPANVSVSIQVTPASGSTPARAAITLTPLGTFTGTINLLIGVRDQTLRGGTTLNSLANFDTQQITLTVNPVNHAPNAPGGSTSTPSGQAVSVQLPADDGDADKTQTLTFEVVSQPQNGTLAGFNSATGALQYTPNAGFVGADSFTYRVRDNGGTANGGQDASPIATFTVNVGPTTPTGLAMSPASDDGLFNDDRVISNLNPTFTVDAIAGAIVRLLVNGASQVVASETSPGRFVGTLSRELLRVGANSITATATINGIASPATAPLSFVYAPSYEQVYTVPGDFGSAQQLTFKWTSRQAVFNNEIGVFKVGDLTGRVNGIAPGDPGYAAAALSSSGRQVLFTSGTRAGAVSTISVSGGELLAFYLISNDSSARFMSRNSQNRLTGLNAFFSVESANPDRVDHMRATTDPQTGRVVMHWEDLLFGGDRDYNDVVISITPGGAVSPTVGATLRVPGGPQHAVATTFTLLPTQRSLGSLLGPPAGFSLGQLGVFVVGDSDGTVNGFAPGSSQYLQAVFGSSTRQVLFNPGDTVGTQKTVQIPGGSLIAWYYVSGGTAEDVLTGNPQNAAGNGAAAVFSFDTANPDRAEHFRWFGPERGGGAVPEEDGESGLRLHILDRLFGSPSDFDDLMVSIRFPDNL